MKEKPLKEALDFRVEAHSETEVLTSELEPQIRTETGRVFSEPLVEVHPVVEKVKIQMK